MTTSFKRWTSSPLALLAAVLSYESVRTNIVRQFLLIHLMVITEEFVIMELDGFVAKLWDKSTNSKIRSV
jgi:hypothetical protein